MAQRNFDEIRAFIVGIAVGVLVVAGPLVLYYQSRLQNMEQQWLHRGVVVDYRGLRECLPAEFHCDQSSLVIYADSSHQPIPGQSFTNSPIAKKPSASRSSTGAGLTALSPRAEPDPSAPSTRRASPADGQGEQRAVQQTLERWAYTLARGDLDANLAFYADQVNPYFLMKYPVSKSFVRRDKSRFIAKGTLASLSVQNVRVQFPAPGTAISIFQKVWQTRDRSDRLIQHQSWSRVHLERQSGGWKITGEQDLTAQPGA